VHQRCRLYQNIHFHYHLVTVHSHNERAETVHCAAMNMELRIKVPKETKRNREEKDETKRRKEGKNKKKSRETNEPNNSGRNK